MILIQVSDVGLMIYVSKGSEIKERLERKNTGVVVFGGQELVSESWRRKIVPVYRRQHHHRRFGSNEPPHRHEKGRPGIVPAVDWNA